jgi:metal-dependent hydrolase (beta-lactamase superfamily II)
MLKLKCFKAGKGDSFLITWKTDKEHRLLIDSGIAGTYRFFGNLVKDFGKEDHVILTHVDYDHIGGFFKWLLDKQHPFRTETSLYLNTPQLLIAPNTSNKVGIKHGVNLQKLLDEKGIYPKSLYLKEDGSGVLHLDSK